MSKGNEEEFTRYQKRHAIKELQAQLYEFNQFKLGRLNTKYQITENFRKNGLRTYKLSDLELEIEHGIVIFDDIEHVLLEDQTKVLNNFCFDSIISVVQDWEDNWKCHLRLKDGEILIEKMKYEYRK